MATLRQQRVVAELLENGGSVSGAMRKVGYTKQTAKVPSKLTASKGFRELLEEHLPDKMLAKVHEEGLQATKLSNSLTAPDMEIPDFQTRHKYLDLAYKVKGKITPDPPTVPVMNTYNLFYQPSFQQSVKAFEQSIKSLITKQDDKATEAPLGAE